MSLDSRPSYPLRDEAAPSLSLPCHLSHLALFVLCGPCTVPVQLISNKQRRMRMRGGAGRCH